MARIRANVEHPIRVIKQQFGYQKTRLRGMVKQLIGHLAGTAHNAICTQGLTATHGIGALLICLPGPIRA